MKPDTWKDWMKTYDNGFGGIDSEQIPVLLKYIAARTALAQKEGVRTAINTVEDFKKEWEISFNDDIRNRFIEKILEALQEKLDTKGV